MTPAQQKNAIEEHVRDAYASYGVRVFWPERFVREEIGSVEEVLRALRGLVEDEKLVAQAQVRCENGHVAWQGSPAEVSASNVHACPECGEAINDVRQVFLRFVVTDAWRALLDRQPHAQKKRLERAMT